MEKENRREQILLAAEKLFAEKSFSGVGIREITAAAAVNSSAISYYFGGKYGLYCAVIENKAKMLAEAINAESIKNMEPKEIISLYAETIKSIHRKYPYFVRLLYHELVMPTDALQNFAAALQPSLQILKNALSQGSKQGIFIRDLDVEKAIMMLAGALNFYFLARPIHQQIIKQDELFADQYADRVLEIFFRGISEDEKYEKI